MKIIHLENPLYGILLTSKLPLSCDLLVVVSPLDLMEMGSSTRAMAANCCKNSSFLEEQSRPALCQICTGLMGWHLRANSASQALALASCFCFLDPSVYIYVYVRGVCVTLWCETNEHNLMLIIHVGFLDPSVYMCCVWCVRYIVV